MDHPGCSVHSCRLFTEQDAPQSGGWVEIQSPYTCVGGLGWKGFCSLQGLRTSLKHSSDYPAFGVTSVHLSPQSDKDPLRTAPRSKVLPLFLDKASGAQRRCQGGVCLGSGAEFWIKVPTGCWGRRSV